MKRELYCQHYERHPLLVERPERREIALQLWGTPGPSSRHQYYQNTEDLKADLVRQGNVCAVFSSVAYYEDAQVKAPSKKGYLGADLVFDIDLPIEGSRYDWMYTACDATLDLVKVLTDELGFSEESLVVDFSGSKGFHITVNDDSLKDMPKEDRAHLIQYILGEKVDRSLLGEQKGGWSARYEAYKARLGQVCCDDKVTNEAILSKVFNLPQVHAKKLGDLLSKSSNRAAMKGSRLKLSDAAEKSLTGVFFRAEKAKFSGVDKQVTVDKHRIFRIPGSIHPKTGFVSTRVLLSDLSEPDQVFEKIKVAGGLDEVTVTLTEAKVENSDKVQIWAPGTYKLPRWLALHLLSVDN